MMPGLWLVIFLISLVFFLSFMSVWSSSLNKFEFSSSSKSELVKMNYFL